VDESLDAAARLARHGKQLLLFEVATGIATLQFSTQEGLIVPS
jgi:hypothetical protein